MRKAHSKVDEIDSEFENFLVNLGTAYGQPSIMSKIVSILILEGREMSMEEIVQRTRYSLSSVSNSIKNLENMGMIVRVHKAGTKRVYVRIHKNLREAIHSILDRMYELRVKPMLEKLPEIIEKYNEIVKSRSGEESEKARRRIENLTRLKSDLEILTLMREYLRKCQYARK